MPPPTASGMKTLREVRATTFGHDFASVTRRRDVQKYQFVSTLLVVAISQFNRIARIAEIDEVHTFDHASFGYVEVAGMIRLASMVNRHDSEVDEIPHDRDTERPGFLKDGTVRRIRSLIRGPPYTPPE